MAVQTVVPTTQVSNSPAWSPSGGGSILPLLSDGSDSTGMSSPSSPDLSDHQVTMGNPAGTPRDNNGHACVIRCKALASAGGWIIVKVYSSGGTLAATLTTQSIISTTLQTITLALTSGQAGTAGFNGVKLEVIANQNGFGTTFLVADLSFQFSINDQTVSPSTVAGAGVANTHALVYDQTVSPSTAAAAGVGPTQALMYDQTVSPSTAVAAAVASFVGLSPCRSIDRVLADPGAPLDVVLEVHGALKTDPLLVDTTFYFSIKGRRNDLADSPPSVSMPPYLQDPGGVDFLLGEDLTLGTNVSPSVSATAKRNLASDELAGAPQFNWKQAQLDNSRGQVDWMKLWTFSGRRIAAWVGREREAFRCYAPLYAGATYGEPLVGTEYAQFQTGHPIAQMDEVIPVATWLGMPVGLRFLTTSATMLISTSNVAFQLQAFTLVFRYRLWSYPVTTVNLFRRSGGSVNWCTITFNSTSVQVTDTVGGVAEMLAAPITPLDGNYHTIVVGRNLGAYWYIMVDGVPVATAVPLGPPDISSATMTIFEAFANVGHGEGLDARIYNRYYDTSEAGSLTGSRVEGTEDGLVALWRCDDGLGNTVTDYAGGFNATLGGTLGTDFSWVQTNLGEAPLAGQPIPQLYGLVANAKAQVIDGGQVMPGSKVRIQYDDAGDATIKPVLLRAQGAPLILGTDYTYVRASNDRIGVLEIVGGQSEPFTFEAAPDTTFLTEPAFGLDMLIQQTAARANVAGSAFHQAWIATLHAICPYNAGYVLDQNNTKLGDWLSTILQGVGAHQRLSRDGRLVTGFVLPPVSPGPYGGPALEFTAPNAGVVYPSTVGILPAGSHTVGGWITTFSPDLDPVRGGDTYVGPIPAQSLFSYYDPIGNKGVQLGISRHTSTGTASISVWYPTLTPSVVTSNLGQVKFGISYFVASVYNAGAGTISIYLAERGGQLRQVGSATGVTGTFGGTAGFTGPAVGLNVVGSVGHVFVYSTALSFGTLQTIMATQGPTLLMPGAFYPVFYAALNDGNPSTTAVEAVSGTPGTITGYGDYARWAPKAVIDLSRLADKALLTRNLVPAWSVAVQCATNYYQMKDAEILTAVAKVVALGLKSPGLVATWTNLPLFQANREALAIVLASVLRNKPDAQKLLRNLLYRYADGRGLLAIPKMDRRAILLDLTDEVWVYAPAGRSAILPASPAFRIVGSKPDNKSLTTDLTLWS